jgi:hypothetical protein
MTIATDFLAKFGEDAFVKPDDAWAAMRWLAKIDPDGAGQLSGDVITYAFTDSSRLVFDTKTRRFSKPN